MEGALLVGLTEALNAVAALIGALTGLVGAVVTVLQMRERRGAKDASSRSVAERTHLWLARPGPILAMVTVLVSVSVLFLVQLSKDETAPPPTAIRLLRQLVSKEAQACRQVAPAPRAIAALSCRLQKPMSELRISLFASNRDLRRTVQEKASMSGVASGDCSTQRLAWEKWALGRLVCDYGGAGIPAKLEWSREDSQVLLEAEARERADEYEIYSWWTREGNGAPVNNRIPYPDRYERYILERTELKTGSCERGYDYKGSAGSVRCEKGPADYFYVNYYFSERALERALHVNPGSGTCTLVGTTPGRRGYHSRGVVGIRQCYVDDGTSVVEWTNPSSRLYGFARLKSGSPQALDRLFRWWERQGRYVTD